MADHNRTCLLCCDWNLCGLRSLLACYSVSKVKSFLCLHLCQGSRDDLSVGGGVTSVTRHGNSVDASFSKEVLNSITGSCVCVCGASEQRHSCSLHTCKNLWISDFNDCPPPPPAFSSLAVAACNQADSRGSLISVDSNPSNSDRNSEKMDGCEKVTWHPFFWGWGWDITDLHLFNTPGNKHSFFILPPQTSIFSILIPCVCELLLILFSDTGTEAASRSAKSTYILHLLHASFSSWDIRNTFFMSHGFLKGGMKNRCCTLL